MIIFVVLLGFAALMAGTYRQSRDLLGSYSTSARRRRLLVVGYGLLALSLVPVCRDPDWARRLIEWFGDLSVAALLTISLGWCLYRVRNKLPDGRD